MVEKNIIEFVLNKVRPAIQKIYESESKTICEFCVVGDLTGTLDNGFIVSIRFEVFDQYERPNGMESWIIGYDGETVTYMIVEPKHVEKNLLWQLLDGGLQWDSVLKV